MTKENDVFIVQHFCLIFVLNKRLYRQKQDFFCFWTFYRKKYYTFAISFIKILLFLFLAVGVEDLPPRGEVYSASSADGVAPAAAPAAAEASSGGNLDPKLLAAVNSIIVCTSCKESGVAVARCSDCKTFLCQVGWLGFFHRPLTIIL